MRLKKWIALSSLILALLLFAAWMLFSLPGDATVKREFSKIKPNADVVEIELLFEFEPGKKLLYTVKSRESQDSEIMISELMLKRDKYFRWHWCDDRTERKCESIK